MCQSQVGPIPSPEGSLMLTITDLFAGFGGAHNPGDYDSDLFGGAA